MEANNFVVEIIMESWPEWAGNELYADFNYAKFCGVQDYKEAFYGPWMHGDEESEEPGVFKWEPITKGVYFLYEDGSPTEVYLRFRHVNQVGD